jgi:branched-chain amino acid transport system substrate-binding protein
MKLNFNYILIIFIFFSISGCEKLPEPVPLSGLKIKIGIITSNTGENSAIGKQGLKGIKSAQVLQPYLDNGDEIELIIVDDKSNPDTAVNVFDKLATELKVSAILLLSGSNSAIAIAKIADKYKTPILTTIATNPEITQHSEFMSQLSFDDSTQAIVAALYIRDELFIKHVSVFSNPENRYSEYLAKEFSLKIKDIGGSVTDFINLSTEGENDYPSILRKIKKKNPVLLFLPIKTQQVLAIAKAADDLNWTPKMLVTDGMLSRVYMEHKSDLNLVDGMLATDLYSSNMDLSPYGQNIFNALDKSDVTITSHLLTGVEGYGFLLNAINQCEAPVSRRCINNAIRTGSVFTGISGRININKNGKAERTLFINKIEGHDLKLVVKVN